VHEAALLRTCVLLQNSDSSCDTSLWTRSWGRAFVQVSLWNFVKYNVIGGGESALYGVEPWHYYLVNGALNFNVTLLLALAYPLLAGLQSLGLLSLRFNGRLAMAMAPLFVWLTGISALPHKEERFLYVTYPQVCCSPAVRFTLEHLLQSTVPAQTPMHSRPSD
jgi:Alg9-like mannosyltransferase family